MKSISLHSLTMACLAIGFALLTPAPASSQIVVERAEGYLTVSPQVYADFIRDQVAAIRGLRFKDAIRVQNQSIEDFDVYLERELRRQLPEGKAEAYGKIVKKLGLHRGPVIEDFIEMTKMVMKSQAAAYYDPETATFYVLMNDMPEIMIGGIYAHELYHGLQDQYFDLDRFILSQSGEGATLNDDELLARQAVVEGEATYVMTIWTLTEMFGTLPDHNTMRMAVDAQTNLDVNILREMVRSGALESFLGSSKDLEKAVKAMDDIPAFMLETLVGAYLKGQAFVMQVQMKGWEEVEALFDDPPMSTEQILHPEKYFAREYPFRMNWNDIDEAKVLRDWKLLDQNTLGEIQMSIVFAEHNMRNSAKSAAAGWDGDRYAVFERPESAELMLLLYTSWDDEAEAAEFARAYEQLLAVKYPNGEAEAEVRMQGRDVLIAEAPAGTDLDKLFVYMRTIEKEKRES